MKPLQNRIHTPLLWRYDRSMTGLLGRLRAMWRRVMRAERTADDLPQHHDGPAPSDLLRTLPPGGGGGRL